MTQALSRHPHRPWVSRDYNHEVTCNAAHCPAHSKHDNTCAMPSAIVIGADMKCSTGVVLAQSAKPQPPKPLDGD